MNQKTGAMHPFIIYSRDSIEDIRQCIIENYGIIKYELPFISALCVDIPEEKAESVRHHAGVAEMSENIDVSKLSLKEESRARPPGTCFLRGRRRRPVPVDGEGVTIAVIDTGFAPHYDLLKPVNRLLCFKDFVHGHTFPYDDDGHGTHVAGIAAGNAYVSGHREQAGTAPKCNLIMLKALDENGNGSAFDILAAMQWIADNHKKYNVRVVNLSLGVEAESGAIIDPLVLGVNSLTSAGLSVVAAAGNSGPGSGTITSPGISPQAITVGSCHEGKVADFSSRGPTMTGKIKPDLVAPGVEISSLSWENCKGYVSQSGTSMSCPYVAGIVADLYSRRPELTPHQIKRILFANTIPLSREPANAQGFGEINI